MSPDNQQIAIAEACKIVSHDRWGPLYKTDKGFVRACPDYLTDLNAMNEAEKVLVEQDLWWKYCTHLNAIVCADADEPLNQDPETLWCMIHATAAQRAEAFLRTLGKWEDGK